MISAKAKKLQNTLELEENKRYQMKLTKPTSKEEIHPKALKTSLFSYNGAKFFARFIN